MIWVLLAACTDPDPVSLDGPTSSTTPGTTVVREPTPLNWAAWLPPGFPVPQVPEDNPITEEKVELGRHLFYDEALSGNGTQACATCHEQALGFAVPEATSLGSTGQPGVRNAMALVNVAYNTTQTWANPVLETLEQQIQVPLFGEFPVELGVMNNEDVVLQRFADDPLYDELFLAAYPEDPEPDFHRITQSLASFLRVLISGDSAFDRHQRGDDAAMSESAKRGLALFFEERLECHHCHGGFNFTLSSEHESTTFEEKPFHNTGLYNVGGMGAYPPHNPGVYDITGVETDMGRFKAPTLRNVAVTAPYVHDGTVATLEEMLDIYARGGRLVEAGPYAGDGRDNPHKSGFVSGFELTDQERADLIAFLEALTDDAFLTDPRFADPF